MPFFFTIIFLFFSFAQAEELQTLEQNNGDVIEAEVQTPINASLLGQDKLHIYFCGTGGPQVTMQAIRRPPCLAFLTKGDFFVIDAGQGTDQTLAALGLPYKAIDKAFITHWH